MKNHVLHVTDKEIFFPRLTKSKQVKSLTRDGSNAVAICTKVEIAHDHSGTPRSEKRGHKLSNTLVN